MTDEKRKALVEVWQWFERKTEEYATKSGNLFEVKEILGVETYEKCKAFYSEKFGMYEEMRDALDKYIKYEDAESDILSAFMDIPDEEEMETIKANAKKAYEFYLHNMP